MDIEIFPYRVLGSDTTENFLNDLESLEKHIPYGFDINQDRSNYIRKQKTVTDRIKYGNKEIPDELVGMTDQYSTFDDHVNIIKKDDED